MNKKQKESLLEARIKLLNDYAGSVARMVDAFMKKWLDPEEYHYYDYHNDIHWVGGRIGEWFTYGDFAISFSDVLIDIRLDAPKGLWLEWHYYSIENTEGINYESWVKGLRETSVEQHKREKIESAQSKLSQALKEFKTIIDEFGI